MRVVLGIDAAWTPNKPSGVAVAKEIDGAWQLVAVAASYDCFHAIAAGLPESVRPTGCAPDATTLLTSSQTLCGRPVDLVAIDMPLAYVPISGRRKSDNLVSEKYGARKCGTHSPNGDRPGRISDDLRVGFERAGYPLQTIEVSSRGLIEVYPHPALVELAGAQERLPYKMSKIRSYWPGADASERKALLFEQWAKIVLLLETQLSGVANKLLMPRANAHGIELKSYEDMLDAVVCAWVAICALEGRARKFGDDDSAIWIPKN